MNSRAYPGFKNPPSKRLIFNISAIIVLSCVGILIYSNTLHSPFQFDDTFFIKAIEANRFSTILGILHFWTSRFILFLTFAINYKINGFAVFGYHLVNLIIHLGSSAMVFWLTLLLLSTPKTKDESISKHALPIALFTALIFLSHPIQTQSVTYIFQRASCLAGLFYILSICLYLKSRLLQEEGKKWVPVYIFSFASCLLAMFTKENTLTLPVMILLSEFFFFKKRRYRYAILFLILIPITPILLILTKSLMSKSLERVLVPGTYNELYYFLTQFRVMITYIRLSFIPINQNLDYDYPLTKSLFDIPSLLSLLVLAIIIISAFKLFKRYRLISFSIFWFFITILPELSLVHVRQEFIFEHWLYLPLFGYGLFLVSVAYYLLGKSFFKTMVSTLLVIAACYSILAYNRNLVWRDRFTLWNDTVLKSPQKARPYNNRGLAYFNKGNLEQAISDYNKAITINPEFAEAYNNRGFAYFNKGNLEQAISDYNKAITINPGFAEAYNNRGLAYFNKGDLEQAISDYNKAITINPGFAGAYNNRGVAYFNKGNLEQAISDYNKTITINPGFAGAYNNRGLAYFYKKDYDKTWKDVHKAEVLGYKVDFQFIAELKKASGREK